MTHLVAVTVAPAENKKHIIRSYADRIGMSESSYTFLVNSQIVDSTITPHETDEMPSPANRRFGPSQTDIP